MKLVSIICVYNKDYILNENLLNSLKIQNTDYELILIDNRNFKFSSAASALNYGAKKANGKYFIFTHQDVRLCGDNWIEKTINQIEQLVNPGIIGVSGKSHDKIMHSNVRYGKNSKLFAPVKLKKSEEATTLDDCLFIIPRKVFNRLKFDEKTCFDWYLNAVDYLLSIKKFGFNAYLIPSDLEHKSDYTNISSKYYDTLSKLQKKHFNEQIIQDILFDWKTYLPITFQKNLKNNNSKDSFKNYIVDKSFNEEYKDVDEKTYEIIKNSGLFDETYYKINYHIDCKEFDPLTHYLTVGYKRNYNPSLKFDTEDYFKYNPDVEEQDLNPLEHYLKWGKSENRIMHPVKKGINLPKIKHEVLGLSSNHIYYILVKSKFNPNIFKQYLKDYGLIKKSELFDEEFYAKRYNSDLKNFNNNPLIHYMFIGVKKNFLPNNFLDCNYYFNRYGQDINPIVACINNMDLKFTDEFVKNHELVENSKLFDEEFYLKNYPNINSFKDDLITHYMIYGYKKGFNPSENFYTQHYLDSYEDVAKSGMNPLVHYLKFGQYENRLTKAISQKEANEIIENINLNARDENLNEFDENSPLVSIIILNRNGIDYLKTLFKNFENTICYPNYEIIVVDNDSTDESVNYLKEISLKLPLKIIENKTNESFSYANNKAVESSNGEFVLLLNNDMEPIYGWLNHMMASYLKSDDIGIVGAKLIYPFRENNFTSLKTQNEGIKYTELNGFLNQNDGYIVPYNIKNNDIFEDNENDREIASVLGASLLIKKDLYLKVGGLDEGFIYNYEDLDLCFKIMQEGYKVIYSPKSKLYHYYQATRKDAFDLSPNDMKNRIHLYQKWNKWLCEKLFYDRLNNELIFSENELNITYISNNPSELINDDLIELDEFKNYPCMVEFINNPIDLKIKKLGWNLTFLKNDNLKIKNNSDIVICDDSQINPNNLQHNNIHLIKIAIIKSDVRAWLNNKFLKDYDVILSNANYLDKIDGENIYCINEQSVFLQIYEILNEIYKKDNIKFNILIKNNDFENTYPNGKYYLSILNSPYFDEKWYMEHYDISNDHLDAVNHYLKIGFKKGYLPGPNFDGEEYYAANPDVKNSGLNPLVHYEIYGRDERRQINCTPEEKKSYKKYLSLMKHEKFDSFNINENQIFFYSPWETDSYGKLNENSQMIYDNLDERYTKKIYTHKGTPRIADNFELLKNLLESKIIILDQGWGLLSEVKLKEEQKVINIWHACGAFKKIGYDAQVYSDEQLENFGKQFRQYNNFIVSSPKIRRIYANAHGMNEKDVLGLGVPRTDLFYDDNYKKEQLNKLYEKYPDLKNKEIILYAPTFRDNYIFDTQIDWNKLSDSLDANEVFVIKRHVMTNEDILNGDRFNNICYIEDVSIFDLMFASKMMITDYSSVIFEYSLLNKPVIHYCPDYEEYISIRDFYLDFETELYGEIVENSNKLIEKIKNGDYELNKPKLEKFKEKFMSACDGHATQRVVELINKYSLF